MRHVVRQHHPCVYDACRRQLGLDGKQLQGHDLCAGFSKTIIRVPCRCLQSLIGCTDYERNVRYPCGDLRKPSAECN